jgi:hypothetical protein
MGPVNLVACCWWIFGFLHYFTGWLRRETGYGSTDRSAGMLGIVSGAVTPSNSVGGSWKIATYGDRPQEAYPRRTWTDVGSIRVVLVGFSPAGCTSIRIAATLRYE